MVIGKLMVVIVAVALGALAIGTGYFLTTQQNSLGPTGPQTGAPPTVASTSPANLATATPFSAKITATFSRAMDPSTITASTFTLKQGTTSVTGIVSYAGTTATFTPSTALAPSTLYTATITIGAKDTSPRALAANFVWSFTTAAVPLPGDTTRPAVSSTSPVVAVAVNGDITATFSEAMDPTTISTSTFTLMQGTTSVSGIVSYSGVVATFNPSVDLATDTSYTATITAGAKDVAGNALQGAFVWSLTTSSAACVQGSVDLASAVNFAVLAGSTVTNTGATTVTGDLGLSPGSDVVGFPPGTVVGTIHAADPAAASAIADLTIAYNDAAGRTLCPVSVSGNLGGMTLTAGLYKSTSGIEISSGDLTLDAQGDANAVFIFQIASTLDVASGLHVYLAGGAKASNVFWQVGTSASLGTGCAFIGTIMADQSISLATGASLDGRAMARIGAVTLDASVVTKPTA